MTARDRLEAAVGRYRDAWLAGDLDGVLACYHRDFTLHYAGESPLAGTHVGRDAALVALAEATVRSERQLVAVEDLLVGDGLAALVAIEDLGDPPRRCRRVLLYRVEDDLLRECWLFDEDQRFVDALWSRGGPGGPAGGDRA